MLVYIIRRLMQKRSSSVTPCPVGIRATFQPMMAPIRRMKHRRWVGAVVSLRSRNRKDRGRCHRYLGFHSLCTRHAAPLHSRERNSQSNQEESRQIHQGHLPEKGASAAGCEADAKSLDGTFLESSARMVARTRAMNIKEVVNIDPERMKQDSRRTPWNTN